jgi:hypothetical protein
MQPPNVENLFLAGGIIFFFDPGTGERDLGLIEEPPDVEPKSTEVKVYSNRSGKRRLVKTFSTEEEVTWNFKLQELVAANMQAFFKGGPLEVVGAGTAQMTDQEVTLSGETLVSLGKYGISAVTVTNLAGDHTYIHNSDYVIDPGQVAGGLLVGRIGRIAGGAITDGQQVKVSFTYTTWSSLRFPVASDNYQQGAARLQFRPSRGLQWNYIIPKCQLKPNGKLTFDDKKPMELPMILEVLDASAVNPDAPYGYWECLNES